MVLLLMLLVVCVDRGIYRALLIQESEQKKCVCHIQYVSSLRNVPKLGISFWLCFNSSSSSLGAVVLVGVTPLITEKVN